MNQPMNGYSFFKWLIQAVILVATGSIIFIEIKRGSVFGAVIATVIVMILNMFLWLYVYSRLQKGQTEMMTVNAQENKAIMNSMGQLAKTFAAMSNMYATIEKNGGGRPQLPDGSGQFSYPDTGDQPMMAQQDSGLIIDMSPQEFDSEIDAFSGVDGVDR